MRLAWFSPIPPVKSGIAGRSAELVARLRGRGLTIDLYVDEPVARLAPDARSAHDFVWTQAQRPYDATVFQFGNSSHHDYAWPYALRYPGLVVLHDTHLHHARAAALLREKRIDDYRREFAWNHPGVSRDLAEVAVAGLDSALYYEWPMVRALVTRARLVAVHGEGTARELREQFAGAPELADKIVSIQLGEGVRIDDEFEREARTRVRARHGIPQDAVLFAVFGGLTPEKRIPQALAALAATVPHTPHARLMLAGAPAAHYDVAADVRRRGLSDHVVITGYLDTDEELTEHIAACDVSLNLRWPTARETSGPWLRALAAGRATVITDLAHLDDVPSLDPRTWRANGDHRRASRYGAVSVAIDILDEDHSLRLAMRRLAGDPALRQSLGRAAVNWWRERHTVERMADGYMDLLAQMRSSPPANVDLPDHLLDNGDRTLRALVDPFGLKVPL
jgi:glycosyltransferase involved in cell wall biosynthesis